MTFFLLVSNLLSAQNVTVTQDTTSFNGEVTSSDWIDHGLTIGINFSHYLYGEVDYYKSYIWEAGGFPTLSTTMNYGLEFSYLDNLILAPKIQGRVHAYFFNASLAALCYSNLKNDFAIKLRPELGLGLWNIDINYGYNIGVYKENFNKANKHVIALRYYIGLHRKHLNQYDRNGNKKPKN
ncbi:hypothetical protein V6R21_02930 [Limibacter armeniacum]|uniref:hypothetical protein n=1 Tax=Limibacter armeniacum TaxID=466084 RepID=UPI002FE610A9